jgi:hypothetical protein
LRNGRDQLFGLGVGVGIILGLFFGSILVSRLGNEAAETVRLVTGKLLRRGDRVRFEALLQ